MVTSSPAMVEVTTPAKVEVTTPGRLEVTTSGGEINERPRESGG